MHLLESIVGKNYINGKWLTSIKQIPVINPSTLKEIGSVPNLALSEINNAIDNTVKTFNRWSQSSFEQRISILRKWHSLILENIEELSYILTLEQGKILKEAKNEILYGASFVEWYASVIHNIQGTIKPGNNKSHKIITEHEPIVPVACITPWNFPNAMITRKVIPAIAAGCSVILKPSSLTPFSALVLAKLGSDAGLPSGVFNIITGDADIIGKAFCEDFRIRKLSFTGSTNVGKILYQNSASTVKRLSLELGGNVPFIYDRFIEIFTAKFAKLKAGDGLNEQSDIGPLINKAAIDKIQHLLKDAQAKGAKLLCGGKAEGNFLEPTVIVDCTDDMDIFKTEIFGPVVACYKFRTEAEVIERANNTEYGLQCYIYTKNLVTVQRITYQLDFGMISINDPLPANAKAPFAGRKASGFGIEGSFEGIFEYLNTKYINLQVVR